MRNQLIERLQALKAEFEAGQRMLAELEQRHVALEQKLLRVSGAIQVLGEELEKADAGAGSGAVAAAAPRQDLAADA